MLPLLLTTAPDPRKLSELRISHRKGERSSTGKEAKAHGGRVKCPQITQCTREAEAREGEHEGILGEHEVVCKWASVSGLRVAGTHCGIDGAHVFEAECSRGKRNYLAFEQRIARQSPENPVFLAK